MALENMKIFNGPSKFDLMLALFDSKIVEFELEDKDYRVKFYISSIQREDGSGESWNLIVRSQVGNPCQTPMYYRTDRRTGFLRMKEI